jgi:hypothetical protein
MRPGAEASTQQTSIRSPLRPSTTDCGWLAGNCVVWRESAASFCMSEVSYTHTFTAVDVDRLNP